MPLVLPKVRKLAALTVAGLLSVMLVFGVIREMVVLAGMPVPLTVWPTASPNVLDTGTVALVLVVVRVRPPAAL